MRRDETTGAIVNERILIIDDEPWVHEVARGYLEREGYIVYSAMTGREGLALAAAKQPALPAFIAACVLAGGMGILHGRPAVVGGADDHPLRARETSCSTACRSFGGT